MHSLYAQNFNEREKSIIQNHRTEVITTLSNEHLILLKNHSSDISPDAPLLDSLVNVLYSLVLQEEGVGIAAPQIGINRNVFLIQRFDKPDHPFEEFINPKILWTSDLYQKGPEGCLSIPDFRSDIWRHHIIQVEFTRLDGSTVVELIEGFTAVIFQHEFDHLIGRLITDSYHSELNDRMKTDIQNFGVIK